MKTTLKALAADCTYKLETLQEVRLHENPTNDVDLVEFAESEKMDLRMTGVNLGNISAQIDSGWSYDSPLDFLNLASNNITSVESLKVLRIFPNLLWLDISNNENLKALNLDKKRLHTILPKLNSLEV